MDVFSLPDVFLRKLMRTVEIKDRLRMRLTCRAFEKLVAETHAGYFSEGNISLRNYSYSISLGDAKFIGCTELGLQYFLQFHMFNRITFGKFEFNIDCNHITTEFINKFTEFFEFRDINFAVCSDQELLNSQLLMERNPNSKHTMDLWYLPASDKLLSFHSMEQITIMDDEISTDLFFNLLRAQNNLNLGCKAVSLDSNQWKQAMQTVSEDANPKVVRLTMRLSDIVSCLRAFGMSETSMSADRCGEIDVHRMPDGSGDGDHMQLRFRNCWIRCLDNVWTSSDVIATVVMANRMRLL